MCADAVNFRKKKVKHKYTSVSCWIWEMTNFYLISGASLVKKKGCIFYAYGFTQYFRFAITESEAMLHVSVCQGQGWRYKIVGNMSEGNGEDKKLHIAEVVKAMT